MSDVDLAKVKRNVSTMVQKGAPESDIDSYISGAGTTIDAVKSFKGEAAPVEKAPPESGFSADISTLRKIGTDEPGYQYGDILPIKKSEKTGEVSGALPEFIRSPARGFADLLESSQHKSIEETPDSVGAMLSMVPTAKPAATAATKAAEIIGSKAIDVTKSGAKNLVEGAGTMRQGYNARDPEVLEQAIKGKENDAKQHFQSMKGVGVSPEIATKIFDHVDKAVREDTEIDPDIHKDYVDVIGRMKEKAKAGMTLDQLHNQRRLLRAVETKNYINNPDAARVAREAIDAMDEVLETAKHEGKSAEGAQGVHGMQTGIAKWAQARKFETVANVIKRAQGDPNKLKAGFKTLLNSKKQIRGFTKDEVEAIKSASENTTAEALMKMMGKFGFDVSKGSTGGNTLPWLAGFGAHLSGASTPELASLATVGTGAKYGQKLMARGQAENVLKQLESRQFGAPPAPDEFDSTLRQIAQ